MVNKQDFNGRYVPPSLKSPTTEHANKKTTMKDSQQYGNHWAKWHNQSLESNSYKSHSYRIIGNSKGSKKGFSQQCCRTTIPGSPKNIWVNRTNFFLVWRTFEWMNEWGIYIFIFEKSKECFSSLKKLLYNGKDP